MTVLFLTLLDFNSLEEHNIYTDLLREFVRNGHEVYCISPSERRAGIRTQLLEYGQILKLRIGNIQKTNIIEKGISTVQIEDQFVAGVKKFFSKIKFDLVLYTTPPITFEKVVRFIKKRDRARTYLLLKDIFPQNAVDLGMMSTSGIKSWVYKYFRNKEKRLYALSDRIGCMSSANVDYVIEHNSEVESCKIEVCPNSIEVRDMRLNQANRIAIREKYEIPKEKKVFVYGGNLGKPQGIPFVIECLRKTKDVYFLIVGDGTEFGKLECFVESEKPKNVKLIKRLPKEDFDQLIAACDVGLIFLDHRFTIPNFPSRLLSYMQAGLPVFACTDPNSDIGRVIMDGGFGWWCESNDVAAFIKIIESVGRADLGSMGQNAWDYLNEEYSAQRCYTKISAQKECEIE